MGSSTTASLSATFKVVTHAQFYDVEIFCDFEVAFGKLHDLEIFYDFEARRRPGAVARQGARLWSRRT